MLYAKLANLYCSLLEYMRLGMLSRNHNVSMILLVKAAVLCDKIRWAKLDRVCADKAVLRTFFRWGRSKIFSTDWLRNMYQQDYMKKT